jgi:hypothetical protein
VKVGGGEQFHQIFHERPYLLVGPDPDEMEGHQSARVEDTPDPAHARLAVRTGLSRIDESSQEGAIPSSELTVKSDPSC